MGEERGKEIVERERQEHGSGNREAGRERQEHGLGN